MRGPVYPSGIRGGAGLSSSSSCETVSGRLGSVAAGIDPGAAAGSAPVPAAAGENQESGDDEGRGVQCGLSHQCGPSVGGKLSYSLRGLSTFELNRKPHVEASPLDKKPWSHRPAKGCGRDLRQKRAPRLAPLPQCRMPWQSVEAMNAIQRKMYWAVREQALLHEVPWREVNHLPDGDEVIPEHRAELTAAASSLLGSMRGWSR